MMKFFRWRQHKEEELNAEIQSHLDASRSAVEDIYINKNASRSS